MQTNKLSYYMGGLAGLILTLSAALWNNYFAPVSVFPNLAAKLVQLSGWKFLNKLAFITNNQHNNSPQGIFNFQTYFIIGILLGAFLSAVISGKFKLNSDVPELFKLRFGERRNLRFILAFLGGIVMSIGAMIASGCSISYGISAFARFDAAGIITFSTFYFGGILVNWLIYRKVR